MAKEDVLEIEFLDNGVMKVSTDEVSGTNHMNAEALLKKLAQESGGDVQINKKTDAKHEHHHEHDHRHHHH